MIGYDVAMSFSHKIKEIIIKRIKEELTDEEWIDSLFEGKDVLSNEHGIYLRASLDWDSDEYEDMNIVEEVVNEYDTESQLVVLSELDYTDCFQIGKYDKVMDFGIYAEIYEQGEIE